MSIAWSPDGNHLVSGAATGEVCCWIPKTGELDGNPLTAKSFLFCFDADLICSENLLMSCVGESLYCLID